MEETKPALGENLEKTRTIEQVVEACMPRTLARLEPVLRQNGLKFPLEKLYLIAFKHEKRLELYTENDNRKILLATYGFTAYSGKRGPKLREGDGQIPEGIYGVEYLNPNSKFHVSFKINYPNERDRARAQRAGIENPGTDIFIHGGAQTTGCIPVGDAHAEELFTLVALTAKENVQIIIFPNDARGTQNFLPCEICPDDISELYTELKNELDRFDI